MGSWLSSLFTGSNPTISSDIGQLGSLGSYSSNLGQNDTNAASSYYSNLLSGNPQAIAQTLAPEISANQQQAQQQKDTMAQFGNRSGGNTAAANSIDSNSRGNIVNLIGGAMSGAASNLGNLGTSNLGMATNDINSQANLAEMQQQNQANSLFGGLLGGLTRGLGGLATGGITSGLSSIIGGGSGSPSGGSGSGFYQNGMFIG